MPKPIESVRKIIHVSTEWHGNCETCGMPFATEGGEYFQKIVDHYLAAHEMMLIHVGAEAGIDRDGKPCHHTVAVLGQG